MKTIEMTIECPSCEGTGLYKGMAEGKGVAVICHNCKGTGDYEYKYSYNEFTGRKQKEGIERVYFSGYGYTIGLGVINFEGTNGVDMGKEGVSYQEFIDGEHPEHIKTLGCPMTADQGACHKIDGFTDKCNELNGGWLNYIPKCKNQCNKAECWERFSTCPKEV